MFDVDVTACVALFLTNILHLKPFDKQSQSQNCQESLGLLQRKYKSYQSLVKKVRYFFTVEKYQFYSHLLCIEITACDEIKRYISTGETDIGHCTFVQHKINLTDEITFKQRHRRILPAMIEEVRAHIEQLASCGIIRPIHSPWASNVVLC